MGVEKFSYDRRSFVLNLVLLLVLTSAVPLILILPIKVDLWALLMIFALLSLLFILGISPLITSHEIDQERIILRQGFYFRGKIPLENICDIRRILSGPRRTGVFFRIMDSTLFVTSRSYDLIAITLKRPQRFGWALGKKAEKIIFDTTDNMRFINSLKNKTGLIPSSQDRSF